MSVQKVDVSTDRPAVSMQTAIRAWVEPHKPHRAGNRQRSAMPWRPQSYGERVLVFDTETTTDAAQRLLFGFFRLYDGDRLVEEGLIAADVLDQPSMEAIAEYAARCRLPIYSRERFVEEVFYPEVYVLGTLCVGFHISFDLVRLRFTRACAVAKIAASFGSSCRGASAGTTSGSNQLPGKRPSLGSSPNVS
jgi:hypothetical protein